MKGLIFSSDVKNNTNNNTKITIIQYIYKYFFFFNFLIINSIRLNVIKITIKSIKIY